MEDEKRHLFGEFVLDTVRGCLLRAGQPVHLRPQAYRALKYLTENSGRLISKDQLIDEVWDGRAVTDDSLVQCLRDVRLALGDDAGRYLRNERGRGYIFETEPGRTAYSANDRVWSEQVDLLRVVVEDDDSPLLTDAISDPASRSSELPARTGDSPMTHAAASTRLAVKGVKRHGRAAWVVTAVLIIAAVAVASYFKYSKNSSKAISSIAVLPFVNETADQDMDYLSDGLSESLINSLSQLPHLKVIARSSSFKYKGEAADPQKVAAALGVEAIIMGRVAQRDDNLLISVELVDARNSTHVWGEQYNRKATDLLQVQSEISRQIATKLRLRLTGGDQQQLVKRETVHPQAYEMLLKGRFYRAKAGTENQKKAIEYFQQAAAVDPAYALAYAELSGAYSILVTTSVLDQKEFMPKSERAALKALELDEGLVEGHLALAGVKLIAWDWATAERELKRALELNPNLSEAHRRYSFFLTLTRRTDEALAEGNRARELDPLRPNFSWLINERRYDQAIEGLKKALEMGQDNAYVHVQLGYAYLGKGQYWEAIAAFVQAIKLGDVSPDTQVYLGCAYAKAGERAQARAILKRLEESREYVSPGVLAGLYVALCETEQAFVSLERAYAGHDNQLQFLSIEPQLDPLRTDPRFQSLLSLVGLPL